MQISHKKAPHCNFPDPDRRWGGGVLIVVLPVKGGGVLMSYMAVVVPMTIDPRIPKIPGRGTSGFHRSGRHCLHKARSAVRCFSIRMKGELHPTIDQNRLRGGLSCIVRGY